MKGVSDLSDSAPIRTRCPHPSEREHPFFTPKPAENAENDFPFLSEIGSKSRKSHFLFYLNCGGNIGKITPAVIK